MPATRRSMSLPILVLVAMLAGCPFNDEADKRLSEGYELNLRETNIKGR